MCFDEYMKLYEDEVFCEYRDDVYNGNDFWFECEKCKREHEIEMSHNAKINQLNDIIDEQNIQINKLKVLLCNKNVNKDMLKLIYNYL